MNRSRLIRTALVEPSTSPTPRHPVEWSDAYLASLRAIAAEEVEGLSELDRDLAPCLLACSAGQFSVAEQTLLSVFEKVTDEQIFDGENFISLLNCSFTCQRLDLVKTLLVDRYGFHRDIELRFENESLQAGVIGWEITNNQDHVFTFQTSALQTDASRIVILGLNWQFPMFSEYSRRDNQSSGKIIFNHFDIGLQPGLSYCDNRPDYYLIPDCLYIATAGYRDARRIYAERALPWHQRADRAFWRGSTTGRPREDRNWRTIPRVELAEFAKRNASMGLFDVALSSVAQIEDPVQVAEIRSSGLVAGGVPWEDWGQFKYQIDVDGNTNAWSGLFYRLLTGSTVLKIDSPDGYQQWYYDRLSPWRNYVPVSPNLTDVIDKLKWLRANDDFAERIGKAGRELALSMTYESELDYACSVISRAFGYAAGKSAQTFPFGWVIDPPTSRA